jgi:hypothetical protein
MAFDRIPACLDLGWHIGRVLLPGIFLSSNLVGSEQQVILANELRKTATKPAEESSQFAI